jgi:hypothetical protein
MYLAIHTPLFGSVNIDSQTIECPNCPRGKERGVNDWQEKSIATCNSGDEFICNRCGSKIIINWGLEEPDHLSNWINSEHCPHRLCKIKAALARA